MLWRISRTSMEAFDEESKRQFARRVAARLAKEFPDKADNLPAQVDAGIRAALRYDIEYEEDIETFLRLFFQADFDIEGRWPWAGSMLDNRELDADTRLTMLLKTLQ